MIVIPDVRGLHPYYKELADRFEDEAISLMSVDFGVTQVVDGNWGGHAIIKKSLFAGA